MGVKIPIARHPFKGVGGFTLNNVYSVSGILKLVEMLLLCGCLTLIFSGFF